MTPTRKASMEAAAEIVQNMNRTISFNREASPTGSWLPDMDLNHDKQIQSLLCYRYTIGQSVRGLALGIRA